ncbi:hypothetical protein ACHAXR_011220 [Thalassiosira sp. AJA248-18]
MLVASFFVKERPSGILEPDNKTIDVKRSFAPGPTTSMIAAKILFFVWTLVTILIDNIYYFEHSRYFSLAYLTRWALVVALFYQAFFILVLATLSKSESGVAKSLKNNGGPVPCHWLIRTLWCLFSIAATLGAVVALSYWPLFAFGGATAIHDTTHLYINVMTHGGVAVLVLIDGLCLNRTPLRMRQVIFPMLIGIAYDLWTVLHWQLGIGNPEEEFDGIYEGLDWENNTLFSLFGAVLFVIVIIPVVFLGIRMLSLWSGWFKFDGSFGVESKTMLATNLGKSPPIPKSMKNVANLWTPTHAVYAMIRISPIF